MCIHEKTIVIKGATDQGLTKCLKCNLIFNPKLISKQNIYNTYDNYYKEGYPSRFSLLSELLVVFFRFLRAVRIKIYKRDLNSLLDIGCGRGLMIYILFKLFKVNTVEGTQIEENSYKYAKEKLGLTIYNEDLPELGLPEEKYDVISYWHVLEHLQHPEMHIKEAYRLLDTGGLLVIEVPNYDSWTRRITGKYWLSYDPKNHIYFFSKRSLESFVESFGFKLIYYQSFSLEYSMFTSCQSFASWLTRSPHLLFLLLQRKIKFNLKVFFQILLFILLLPFAIILNLILFKSAFGEVNHCVFIKTSKSSKYTVP